MCYASLRSFFSFVVLCEERSQSLFLRSSRREEGWKEGRKECEKRDSQSYVCAANLFCKKVCLGGRGIIAPYLEPKRGKIRHLEMDIQADHRKKWERRRN